MTLMAYALVPWPRPVSFGLGLVLCPRAQQIPRNKDQQIQAKSCKLRQGPACQPAWRTVPPDLQSQSKLDKKFATRTATGTPVSEANARTSETNARSSETNANTLATNSRTSGTNGRTGESNARVR